MHKKIPCLPLLFLTLLNVHLNAQDYQITFAIMGGSGAPDSVYVENKDQAKSLTMNGNDILHLFGDNTGASELSLNMNGLRCYPNPVLGSATIEITGLQTRQVTIQLCDIQGRELIHKNLVPEQGTSSFTLSNLGRGIYLLSVHDGKKPATLVIISQAESGGAPELNRNGPVRPFPGNEPAKKSSEQAAEIVQMQYNDGEVVEFTAYSDQESSNVVSLVPEESQALEFSFPPPLVVDFTASTYTMRTGTEVSFTDVSKGGPTSRIWDFGDGDTSTEQNPSHTYSTEGSYSVKLTASNDRDTVTRTRMEFVTDSFESLYGIKHGNTYGYINSKGDIVLDSLDDAFPGEISGERAYTMKIVYELLPGGIVPVPVLKWKCYYRDGSVRDIARDYYSSGSYYSTILVNGYSFFNKRAIVIRRDARWIFLFGFVDEDGEEVIPCQYLWVGDFSEGLAPVVDTVTNQVGFIDTDGNYAIQPQYKIGQETADCYKFIEGKAVVETPDGNYYIIDKQNNNLTHLSAYDSTHLQIIPSGSISEGLLNIWTYGGNGYVNTSGEWEIEPQFSDAGDFHNGLAVVSGKNSNKQFYIDRTGNRAFPGDYYQAGEFDTNGLAWVVTYGTLSEQKGMFIDKTGNQAFPGQSSGLYTGMFVNGLALVNRDFYTWKYINTSGETVLVSPGSPVFWPQTDIILRGYFGPEGIALIDTGGTYAYINAAGEIIWQSEVAFEY